MVGTGVGRPAALAASVSVSADPSAAGAVSTSAAATVVRRGADDAPRLARLKAVADPTRLAVLDTLSAGGLCHGELEEALDVPANRLSFHLRVLRDAGLVTATRCGRWVRYHLDVDGLAALHRDLPVPDPDCPPIICDPVGLDG